MVGRRLWFLVVYALIVAGLPCLHVQAATVEEIEQRGTVKIGVKDNLPLLGFRQPSGELTGFEIELAKKITRSIWGDRVTIEYVPLLNQNRLAAVTDGTVDMAIANLHATDTRRRVVLFSQPYLTSRTAFITLLPQSNLASLGSGTVGVLQGSVAIGRVRTSLPGAKLLGIESYGEALEKLKSKKIDSFAGDALILKGWEHGGKLAEADTALQLAQVGLGFSPVAIAMPKGLQHLNFHQAVDRALDELKTAGTLEQMRNRWKLSVEDPKATDGLN
ncbi:MAG: transporter substrate-binding domain-containing protein [Cyanobacteria bacterium P01_F01_bin.42]